MDSFQFFTSSADVAPGKGVGESISNPELYAPLKKIPGWRRILAEAHVTGNDPTDPAILPLTLGAELWFASPRKPRVRATNLETIRTTVQDKEMEPPSPKPSKAKKSAKVAPIQESTTGGNAEPSGTIFPEGALAPNSTPELPTEQPPNLDSPEPESAVRFCPVCENYLYLQTSGDDQVLSRLCRRCGFHQQDENGGLVMEMTVQERSEEGYKILLNEFTRKDPRLPHRNDIKCPEPGCDSNHGKADPDIIYIKYDAINMLYLYICDVCGFQWRSLR